MKRFLNNTRHKLSEQEKENLFQSIEELSGKATNADHQPARRSLFPVLGLSSVTAALLLVLVWNSGLIQNQLGKTGSSGFGRNSKSERTQIVVGDQDEPEPRPPLAGLSQHQDVQMSLNVSEPREEEIFDGSKLGQKNAVKIAGEIAEEKKNRVVTPIGTESAEYNNTGNTHTDKYANYAIDSAAMASSQGSVTGGTTPPNDKTYELMYFNNSGVNPFVATEDDALSTFAVDVDNASYTLARNYLQRGLMPNKDGIRVEEFVNFFNADLPDHSDSVFRIHADGAPAKFGSGYHLLRVGLKGKSVSADQRKLANLIFVIDVSGSMDQENRLELVKKALFILLDELREGDRVGLVIYGSQGQVQLELTDISRREQITRAIRQLGPGGSTNAAEGLELAYNMARKAYRADRLNRLILCSDGVANTGRSTSGEGILDLVRRSSDEGITLSTIGFGMGNYNDVMMETLADKGDGNYYYVDTLTEAERVFRENLTGTLQTIAREVKVQVEFTADHVQRWRLLGYENRDVADRDFRNDNIDAGEVGAGHEVTALYEIKLIDCEPGSDQALGTIRLRYEAPAHDTAHAGEVTEISRNVTLADLTADYAKAPVKMRLQVAVAEFAEILRQSYWAKESKLADLVPVADGLATELPANHKVQEFARLVRMAADLHSATSNNERE